MTKAEKRLILKLLDRIDTTKTAMAELRDTLREQVYDLEGIVESISDGVEYLEDGRRSFDNALDSLCQYI